MHLIYNFLIYIIKKILPISGWFSSKMKAFVKGRESVFSALEHTINATDKIIWIHAASLGEYEQAVPVMQALKKKYPSYKLLLTFFSPSGYEIKKDNPITFLTLYLPLDTAANAKKFVRLAKPKLAIFVKYEVWPNYLFQLQKEKIPALLLSGVFRKSQLYFKPYGGLMQKALTCFQHIFVQEQASKDLLNKAGFSQVSVSGDTRFDRVFQQLKMNNRLDFMDQFTSEKLCLVCGSTWPEDEAILINFIKTIDTKIKVVIAPHQIKASKIKELQEKIGDKALLYSEWNEKKPADYEVFIIDTVGLLTKIYRYADIAYVGGAMGTTGLHNILEPATFGVPVIFGPHHKNFPEATRLQQTEGGFSIKNDRALQQLLFHLINEDNFRKKSGKQAFNFIKNQVGATKRFMDYLQEQSGYL